MKKVNYNNYISWFSSITKFFGGNDSEDYDVITYDFEVDQKANVAAALADEREDFGWFMVAIS